MDFDLVPGNRNWARSISIWCQEIEIARDGFRSDARRSKSGAINFDLMPGYRNRALTISRTLRLLGFPVRRSRFLPSFRIPTHYPSQPFQSVWKMAYK